MPILNCPKSQRSELAGQTASAPLQVSYSDLPADPLLAEKDVLALFGFATGRSCDDPRWFDVGLRCQQPQQLEVWRGSGPVQHGRAGAMRFATDGEYLFFAIEVDESTSGGIEGAAGRAYRELAAFIAQRDLQVLRLWNYLDAINVGDGDDERYRLFCNGRAQAMAGHFEAPFPAATAIGRQDGVRVLQVYGLAASQPGRPVENPRQVSAWRYPRQYGPSAPTFARAMLAPAGQLLISGTAAVVGHESRHDRSVAGQLQETLNNLLTLHDVAGQGLALGTQSLLKVYLRDPADGPAVSDWLHHHLPGLGGLLMLEGDICRSELLIEVDGISG